MVVNVDGNYYPEESSEFDVVVAVDIGTTYTGYAFAYSKNPNDKQIHMMRQTEGQTFFRLSLYLFFCVTYYFKIVNVFFFFK